MKSFIKGFLISISTLIAITGCAFDQGIHTRNQIANLGIELDTDMVGVNYVGAILEDESNILEYTRATRVAIHGQDASPGTFAEKLRIVPIKTVRVNTNITARIGHGFWTTAAVVPDGTPRLQKFDIVEFRNVGTWRTLQFFETNHEGNAVIKVLCRVSDPNYAKCLDTVPGFAGFKGVGKGTSEYKPHLTDYGFTFTEAPFTNKKP